MCRCGFARKPDFGRTLIHGLFSVSCWNNSNACCGSGEGVRVLIQTFLSQNVCLSK